MQDIRLTTQEACDSIARQFEGVKIPRWKMVRVVDALEQAGKLDVQRVRQYRTISGSDVAVITEELQRRGSLPVLEGMSCS